MDNNLETFIVEYVLTNGILKGFNRRLEQIKNQFSIADKPFFVYRGQGHSKKGIPILGNTPFVLRTDIRSLISTTKDFNSSLAFTNSKNMKSSICCVFKINIFPGIQYLDLIEFINKINIDNIQKFKDIKLLEDPENLQWPTNKMPNSRLLQICHERLLKENEILLLSNGVINAINETFEQSENNRDIKVIEVEYTVPPAGGSSKRKLKRKTSTRKKKRKTQNL